MHENAALIGVLVVVSVVMAGLTNGATASTTNIKNSLISSSSRGIAAVGQMFTILTGGLDISVGGIALMTLMLLATLTTGDTKSMLLGYSMPWVPAIALMLLLGLAFGTLNGFLIARVNIPPLIVTLGMWFITTGIAFRFCGDIG